MCFGSRSMRYLMRSWIISIQIRVYPFVNTIIYKLISDNNYFSYRFKYFASKIKIEMFNWRFQKFPKLRKTSDDWNTNIYIFLYLILRNHLNSWVGCLTGKCFPYLIFGSEAGYQRHVRIRYHHEVGWL